MKKRYALIDLWRTAALITMVAYHLIYDLGVFGLIAWGDVFSLCPQALQRFTCYSFIFISGISCRFSSNNIKRGITTLVCAIIVSIVSFFTGMPILFGILHMLGVSMIFYGISGKYLQLIPKYAAFALWLGLFIATKIWMDGAAPVETRLLFPLGFTYAGFSSSDYFPLLPWLFLFLSGTWLGGLLTGENVPVWLSKKPLPKWLTWPGRHTLVIYMIHQPVLYGLLFLFTKLR